MTTVTSCGAAIRDAAASASATPLNQTLRPTLDEDAQRAVEPDVGLVGEREDVLVDPVADEVARRVRAQPAQRARDPARLGDERDGQGVRERRTDRCGECRGKKKRSSRLCTK